MRIAFKESTVVFLAMPERFLDLLTFADACGQHQHGDGDDDQKGLQEDYTLLHGRSGKRTEAMQRAPDADEGNE